MRNSRKRIWCTLNLGNSLDCKTCFLEFIKWFTKSNFKTYHNSRQYNTWVKLNSLQCESIEIDFYSAIWVLSQLKQVKLDKSGSIKQIALIASSIKMRTTTVHSIKKQRRRCYDVVLPFSFYSGIFDCEFFNIGFYDDGNLILRFFLFVCVWCKHKCCLCEWFFARLYISAIRFVTGKSYWV